MEKSVHLLVAPKRLELMRQLNLRFSILVTARDGLSVNFEKILD